MNATAVLGRPLWYELMTSDMSGAETFYKAAVGWTTTPFDGAGMPYTMWMRAGDVPIGGVMELPAEMRTHGVPPHWLAYIGVDKLEDAVAHVQKLGGTVVSPVIEVPDVGKIRVVKDPQGAAFALYQPSTPPDTPEGAAQVGDVSWLELYTTDNEAAMKFYGDLFGWKPTESMDMGTMGVYRMFGRSHESMGGMMTKTPDMAQLPNAWLLYFRVPDIAAAIERVKANGGMVVHGPMEVPGGDLIVQCTDPQGGMFALHGKKA